ncbi:MAG: hypothetical protein HWN66_22395 [Candidatus Helarchaeota archaeon]|nr:hypothetical protein [Candidatus Helarchaeota archaeon]
MDGKSDGPCEIPENLGSLGHATCGLTPEQRHLPHEAGVRRSVRTLRDERPENAPP